MGKGTVFIDQFTPMDQVRRLDPLDRTDGGRKELEALHRSDVSLHSEMVLLNNIVEVCDPVHLDLDRAAIRFWNLVDRLDPCDNGPGSGRLHLSG